MRNDNLAAIGTPDLLSPPLSHKCEVEILGRPYVLRTDSDEAYTRELAALVDQKMRELVSKVKSTDMAKLAIFAAINIAHELYTLKKQCEENDEIISQKTGDLIESIEEQFEEFRPDNSIDAELAGLIDDTR